MSSDVTYTPTADAVRRDDGWHVTVTWHGPGLDLDRPRGIGWSLGPGKEPLARRLAAAVNAGVVFGPAALRTDVNGLTYVSAESRVLGRRANADLTALGF